MDGKADARSWNEGVRLDLGCGGIRDPGTIGVDRFAGPGVDVVANLDETLPFPESYADHVILSHSLEHVASLTWTMAEVHRICRDRALITIIAPYGESTLDDANPYHTTKLNEHSPRFLTDDPTSSLPPAQYFYPHARSWGLRSSDHSQQAFDFPVLSVKFHDWPDLAGLNAGRRSELRRLLRNVTDEVVIHLVVAKSPWGEGELEELRSLPLPLPEHYTNRRVSTGVDTGQAATQNSLLRSLAGLPEALDALEQALGPMRVDLDEDDRPVVTSLRLEALLSTADILSEQIAELSHRVDRLTWLSGMREPGVSTTPNRSGFLVRLRSWRRLDAVRTRRARARRLDLTGLLRPDLASRLPREFADRPADSVLLVSSRKASGRSQVFGLPYRATEQQKWLLLASLTKPDSGDVLGTLAVRDDRGTVLATTSLFGSNASGDRDLISVSWDDAIPEDAADMVMSLSAAGAAAGLALLAVHDVDGSRRPVSILP